MPIPNLSVIMLVARPNHDTISRVKFLNFKSLRHRGLWPGKCTADRRDSRCAFFLVRRIKPFPLPGNCPIKQHISYKAVNFLPVRLILKTSNRKPHSSNCHPGILLKRLYHGVASETMPKNSRPIGGPGERNNTGIS